MSDSLKMLPRSRLAEITETARLADQLAPHARVRVARTLEHGNARYPIYQFVFGNPDPTAPVLAVFGGVHGIEKIGTQVSLAFLQNIAERLSWDETLHYQLSRARLVVMPLVNPVGMALHRRSNGNHVDLMRNAPVECDPGEETWLVGGHRISRHLPWYRGELGAPMETENQLICDFVEEQTRDSKTVVIVDNHSGFGLTDQIWFPFAKTRAPFPELGEVFGLKSIYDRVNPNHVYRFEPQAKNYTTHGDIWDHLYLQRKARARAGETFLPLTLEMGSWSWVKKNPLQVFSFLGLFNPVEEHRKRRILRRHLPWFDFLLRAVISPRGWVPEDDEQRLEWERKARELWYPGRPLPERLRLPAPKPDQLSQSS